VGTAAWIDAGDEPLVETSLRGCAGENCPGHVGFLDSHIRGGEFCVGIFLHGYPYGGILFSAADSRLNTMAQLLWVQHVLEYMAGEIDSPPDGFPVLLTNILFWGLWWAVLVAIIYIFSGQSSKFIYIDF
jgi:hypothetical protein